MVSTKAQCTATSSSYCVALLAGALQLPLASSAGVQARPCAALLLLLQKAALCPALNTYDQTFALYTDQQQLLWACVLHTH